MNLEFESFNFPTGEKHVRLKKFSQPRFDFDDNNISVEFEFTDNESIIEFLLECDVIKRTYGKIHEIIIPYVPFSRQDRVNVRGECFSLSMYANLINSIGADRVVVYDPHSDVTPALIKNCRVVHQHEIFAPMFKGKKDFWLVSPDGGALKKIYKLAEVVDCLGVLECSKHRDVKTGEITDTRVYTNGQPVEGQDCYIVDDICDGGRTFTEIAKELKKLNVGKIILCVTHGFFTKGLSAFDGLIDEIYTRKGKIK